MRALARALVQGTPEAVLALVLDPERYAQADDKLRAVRWVRRSHDGRIVDFAFSPAVPGLRLPVPPVVVRMRKTSEHKVESGYAPAPHNRLVRRLTTLEASFTVRETEQGTELVRWQSFALRGPLRAPFDRFLARTLQADLEREVAGAAALFETGRAAAW